MGKIFVHFLTYSIRKPYFIYDFAPDPIWISLYRRQIFFSFLSVHTCTIVHLLLFRSCSGAAAGIKTTYRTLLFLDLQLSGDFRALIWKPKTRQTYCSWDALTSIRNAMVWLTWRCVVFETIRHPPPPSHLILFSLGNRYPPPPTHSSPPITPHP